MNIMKMLIYYLLLFVTACLLSFSCQTKGDLFMKVTHKPGGLVEFERSKPKKTGSISVYSNDDMLWLLKYGHHSFAKITYGEIPKFSNSMRMNPKQVVPFKGSPRKLRHGDKISLVLEYSDDKLLMMPSMSAEVWEGVVPETGQTVIWENRKINPH